MYNNNYKLKARLFLITFLLVFIQLPIFGQHIYKSPISTIKIDSLFKGKYVIVGDTTNNTNSGSGKNYIVEFMEEPAIIEMQASPSKARIRVGQAKNRHVQQINRFKNDLEQLMGNHQQRAKVLTPSAVEIKKSYYKVFNGASITSNEDLVDDIERLPYVKRVHIDRAVKISLSQSLGVINTQTVWNDYGIYGEGIKIGVIDTGIDYLHPDLGGGFGPGFKVAGGYDFVNNDNDPMDDHFHGTHVAGIISADGTLKGVAPKATLYGLKALDAYGFGMLSDIVAAIEWTVDPNGDGDFQDKMHVVNMSLGSEEDPNCPMVIAVENAIQAGIVFCIAAGNNYTNYSIGSPGTAPNAITVGSIQKDKWLSAFSSKGPTKNELLKPDILAPGSDINSTVLNNNYESLNGTSMATPHVAGAVALLLNKHQQWTPEQVKSALMTTAQSINFNIWEQGRGVIDIASAIRTETHVFPSSISYGNIGNSKTVGNSTLTKIDTIWLYNDSPLSKIYTATVIGDLPVGYSYTFNQNSLIVPSKQKLPLIFTSSLDINQIPAPQTIIPYYEFKLALSDQNQNSITIPVTFVKKNKVIIEFNTRPDYVLIHDNGPTIKFYPNPGKLFEFSIPNGTYNIVAFFESFTKTVIKEEVLIDENFQIKISSKEAKNKLVFQAEGAQGETVPILDLSISIDHKIAGPMLWVLYMHFDNNGKNEITRYFSDISDQYDLQYNYFSSACMNSEGISYLFPYHLNQGMNSSITYRNNSSDIKKVVYELEYPQNQGFLYYERWFNMSKYFYISTSFTDCDAKYNLLSYPYKIEEYKIKTPDENFYLDYTRYRISESETELTDLFSSKNRIVTTPWAKLDQNAEHIVTPKGKILTGSPIKLLQGPLHFTPSYWISGNDLYFYKKGPFFHNYANDWTSHDVSFSIISNNDTVQYQVTNDAENWIPENYELKPSTDYALQIISEAGKILNHKSEAKFTVRFNSNLNYIVSPDINISMFPNQHMYEKKNSFGMDEQPVIQVKSITENLLYYKKIDQEEWISLTGTSEQSHIDWNYYQNFILPEGLEKGLYSIKISNPNHYDYEINPAFAMLDQLTADSLVLVDLYAYTNGNKWKNNRNWLEGNVNEWYGVSIEHGRIVAIKLPDNNLQGQIPKSLNNLKALKLIDFNNNKLSGLPNLDPLVNLETLNVGKNSLTFKDLLPNVFVQNYIYAPQDTTGSQRQLWMFIGDSISLRVPAYENGVNYIWYKNDELLITPNSTQLSFDSLVFEDSGLYHAEMSHDLLPNLKITSHKLNLNVHQRLFENITDLEFTSNVLLSQGVNWVDFDNDGDLDVFLFGLYNAFLFKNMYKETGIVEFEEIPISGLQAGGFDDYPSNCTWADFDNDGFVDFLITTGISENWMFKNTGNGFVKVENEATVRQGYTYTSSWGDYNNDGLVDLLTINFPGGAEDKICELFENKGNGSFQSVDDFNVEANYAILAYWADVNNDGNLDILIATEDSKLLINNYGEFESTDASIDNWMNGASWGDYNNDGFLDLFVVHDLMTGSKLYFNNGKELSNDNNFVVDLSDIDAKGSAWGDYDNDGDLDIFISSTIGQNVLLQNMLMETGMVVFERVKGFDDMGLHSHGAAWGDYDFDGFIDMLVTNKNGNNTLHRNVGNSNGWISIKCKGTMSNTMAIGTKVRAKAIINGKPVWQLREISAQTGALSQNSPFVNMGFGNATVIDSLVIEWPLYGKQVLTNVSLNQHMEISEPFKKFHLNLLQPEDVEMGQMQSVALPLQVDYNGKRRIAFSFICPETEVNLSFAENNMIIQPEMYLGTTTVTIRATDGELSDEKTIDLKVNKTVTGVSQNESDILIYPNPNNGQFLIQIIGHGGKNLKVDFVNVLGETVLTINQKNLADTYTQIVELNHPNGIYIMRCLLGDEVITKKIINQ